MSSHLLNACHDGALNAVYGADFLFFGAEGGGGARFTGMMIVLMGRVWDTSSF